MEPEESIESSKQSETTVNAQNILQEFDPLYQEDGKVPNDDELVKKTEKVAEEQNIPTKSTMNVVDLQQDVNSLPAISSESSSECASKKLSSVPDIVESSSSAPASNSLIDVATEGASEPSPTDSTELNPNLAQEYHLKWIMWKGERYPIVTQNANGPCPLLSIINVLLLRKAFTIPPMYEIITDSQLMDFLCDSILNSAPSNIRDEEQANYEQNFQDAFSMFPKLATGLDVNVKFADVDQFEYTQESIIFDLLNIPLVHGWLVDPDDREIFRVVSPSSYNQLIDRIISSKGPNGECSSTDMLFAEEFLNETASQLTKHGLFRLKAVIKDDQLAVLFRNNHFITLYKRKNELYQLATDQGFLAEPNVVWETLNSIEGNTQFVDSNFVLVPPKKTLEVVPLSQSPVLDMTNQVDQDHLLALSLAREQEEQFNAAQQPTQTTPDSAQNFPMNDEELAKKLQAEEEEAFQQARQQQTRQAHPQQQQQGAKRHTTTPNNSNRSVIVQEFRSPSAASASHHHNSHHSRQPNFVPSTRPHSSSSRDSSQNRQSPSPSDSRNGSKSKCIIS